MAPFFLLQAFPVKGRHRRHETADFRCAIPHFFFRAGRQSCQQFIRLVRCITNQHHVATGTQSRIRPLDDTACHTGAFHAQVIAENDSVKPEFVFQDRQPFW